MTPSAKRHRAAGRLLLLACIFFAIPLMESNAAPIKMDVIPTAQIEEGWNSNVFNSTTGEVSSFSARVAPGLAVKFTTPDKTELQLSGKYEKVWYERAEAKDAEYNTFYFRVDTTGELKWTENFSLTPSVYYVNTTNSYRRAQLVPTSDPLVLPVSITNYGNNKSQEFGAGVLSHYLLSPNLTLGITGNYTEQRFSDNTAGTGLTNSNSEGVGLSLAYLVSPLTKVGVSASFNRQNFENNPDSDTLTGSVLYGRQISPTYRFDANFGVSYIRQQEAFGVPAEHKANPTGTFFLSYESGTFKAGLNGSVVYSGSSGFGEVTRQMTAGLGVSDKFNPEWSWNIASAYQVSKSAFSPESVNLTTIYGTATLGYQPWEWLGFGLTGNASHQKSNGTLGETLDNYSALLGVTFGKPYNIF